VAGYLVLSTSITSLFMWKLLHIRQWVDPVTNSPTDSVADLDGIGVPLCSVLQDEGCALSLTEGEQ
jgi:hypothetical protein